MVRATLFEHLLLNRIQACTRNEHTVGISTASVSFTRVHFCFICVHVNSTYNPSVSLSVSVPPPSHTHTQNHLDGKTTSHRPRKQAITISATLSNTSSQPNQLRAGYQITTSEWHTRPKPCYDRTLPPLHTGADTPQSQRPLQPGKHAVTHPGSHTSDSHIAPATRQGRKGLHKQAGLWHTQRRRSLQAFPTLPPPRERISGVSLRRPPDAWLEKRLRGCPA